MTMSSASHIAVPAFSYAQAAKGLAPSSKAPAKRDEGSATSEQLTKDNAPTESATVATPGKSPNSKSATDGIASQDATWGQTSPRVLSVNESVEKENVPFPQHHQQNLDRTKSSGSSDLSTSLEAEQAVGLSKDDGNSTVNADRTASWDKESQVSNSVDKQSVGGEKEKGKESEDDWEKVSVPSIAAEKELKDAPTPSVNIWKQRAEAQQAKMRGASQQPASSNVPTSKLASQPGGDEMRRRPLSKESSVMDKDAAPIQKKSVDGSKASMRKESSPAQLSRPVSQHGDKCDNVVPPPVGDAVSWPTPETALLDERRKSSIQDRAEKMDTKANGQRPHNKWVPVPFVPTAKFETPLPPSASRRGGRPNTRGREGTARGGQAPNIASTGEKPDSNGFMGPPALPRQSVEQDRGRKSNGGSGVRASSLPSGERRPNSRGTVTSANRKPSLANTQVQQGAEEMRSAPISQQSEAQSSELAPKAQEASRSSSHHGGENPSALANGDISVQAPNDTTTHGSFPHLVSDATPRYSHPFDRTKATHAGSSRQNGEHGRERGGPRNRDWPREKSDSAREKVESWRDRETSGEPGTRREPRTERGRGGYRGRGNHTSYGAPFTPSHAYTSPLPQNGFETSKSTSVNESRSRQASQPYALPQSSNTNRNNPRSQSIPTGTMYQGFYGGNMPGIPQAMSPVQAEIPSYGYPPQMPMQPGIMSAMPYNDPLNAYALISMVTSQVEYYFSIDNLCKDIFLRRNMDSQGYVPLSVIANFKRIKALTEGSAATDTLRFVCTQVKGVEYLPGENGEDHIRRRDGWRDFVLPLEERLPAARHEGPSQSRRPSSLEPLQTSDIPGVLGHGRSLSVAATGANGLFPSGHPVPYEPLTAAFDRQELDHSFSPRISSSAIDSMRRESTTSPSSQDLLNAQSPAGVTHAVLPSIIQNGHRRQSSRAESDENIFPDEGIPAINIFVRDPADPIGSGEPAVMSNMARVLSNDSSSGQVAGSDSSARVSGLRGGAASPAQLQHLRSMSFGRASPQTVNNDESVVFFTRDGQQTLPPAPQPGQYYQSYEILHDTAIQQRKQGMEGALEPLYSFWSNFLVDKFNVGMYEEFKTLAMDDMHKQNEHGYEHLLGYYNKLFRKPVPMTDRIASDLVKLAREETGERRPVFQLLRTHWRNGATNLKTRKRLGDLLTADEKEGFDKGG